MSNVLLKGPLLTAVALISNNLLEGATVNSSSSNEY
jgi:hypothetical protein